MNISHSYSPPWLAVAASFVLWAVVVAAGLSLQSCATTAPQLSQDLYKADRAITESMLLAADLRTQGLISDADWPQVKSGLADASNKMDEAWMAYDADPEAAAEKLGTAQGILVPLGAMVPAIQEYLLKQETNTLRLQPSMRNVPPKI